MANITIVKLKVRRGSDAQRQEIVLDQGEVGYTLDSKRLFVGDGATYGGTVAGNKNVGPFAADASLGPAVSESPYLQIGDITISYIYYLVLVLPVELIQIRYPGGLILVRSQTVYFLTSILTIN